MFYQLIYSSTATQEFWPDDLFSLVETARRKNAPRSVTGMLLYYEGQFLQLLEGPEREVKSVYHLVQKDRSTPYRPENSFAEADRQTGIPDWTMGFQRLDEAWNLPPAWATILENGLNSAATAAKPSAAADLLLSFQHRVEESSRVERGGSSGAPGGRQDDAPGVDYPPRNPSNSATASRCT